MRDSIIYDVRSNVDLHTKLKVVEQWGIPLADYRTFYAEQSLSSAIVNRLVE